MTAAAIDGVAVAAGFPPAPVASGARFRQVAVAAGVLAGTGPAAVLRWRLAAGAAPLFRRLRRVQLVAALAFHAVTDTEHCVVGGLQGHPVERRDALAGGLAELVGELPGIVRDPLGAVPRPVSVLRM